MKKIFKSILAYAATAVMAVSSINPVAVQAAGTTLPSKATAATIEHYDYDGNACTYETQPNIGIKSITQTGTNGRRILMYCMDINKSVSYETDAYTLGNAASSYALKYALAYAPLYYGYTNETKYNPYTTGNWEYDYNIFQAAVHILDAEALPLSYYADPSVMRQDLMPNLSQLISDAREYEAARSGNAIDANDAADVGGSISFDSTKWTHVTKCVDVVTGDLGSGYYATGSFTKANTRIILDAASIASSNSKIQVVFTDENDLDNSSTFYQNGNSSYTGSYGLFISDKDWAAITTGTTESSDITLTLQSKEADGYTYSGTGNVQNFLIKDYNNTETSKFKTSVKATYTKTSDAVPTPSPEDPSYVTDAYVSLSKTDASNGDILTGCTFELYEYDAASKAYVDTNKKFEYSKLKGVYYAESLDQTTANEGKFEAVETAAQTGYVNSNIKVDFDLTYETSLYTKEITNTPLGASIIINKVESGTTTPVPGCTIMVYQYSAASSSYEFYGTVPYDTASKNYKLSGLTYTADNEGKFRVTETESADGYKLGNGCTADFAIDTSKATNPQVFTFNWENEKTTLGRIAVSKICADTTDGVLGLHNRYTDKGTERSYAAGATVPFKVVVTNYGTKEAVNVKVTDTMETATLKADAESGSFGVKKDDTFKTSEGTTVTATAADDNSVTLDKLPVGASVELNYTVVLSKTPGVFGNLKNSVDVTADGITKDEDDSDSDIVKFAAAKIGVSKLADRTTGAAVLENNRYNHDVETAGTYASGETVRYAVTVTNYGTEDVTDVALSDVKSSVSGKDLASNVSESYFTGSSTAASAFKTGDSITTNKGEKATVTVKDSSNITLSGLKSGDFVTVYYNAVVKEGVAALTGLRNDVTVSAKFSNAGVSTDVTTDADDTDYDIINTKASKASVTVSKLADKTTGAVWDAVSNKYAGTKTIGTYAGGDKAVYTIIVMNNGTEDLKDITVKDVMDADLTSSIESTSAYFGLKEGQSVTTNKKATATVSKVADDSFVLSGLAAGDYAEFNYTLQLKSDVGAHDSLKNTVNVSATYNKTDLTDTDNDSIKTKASGENKISIAKLADRTSGSTIGTDYRCSGTKTAGTYSDSESAVFTIVVYNYGTNDVGSLHVEDAMASELSAVAASGTFGLKDSQKIGTKKNASVVVSNVKDSSFTIDKLASGDAVYFAYTVKFKSGASGKGLVNNVSVKADKVTYDGDDYDSDSVNLTTEIAPTPIYKLSVSKVADKTTGYTADPVTNRYTGSKTEGVYARGDAITWKIILTNTGTGELKNITLSDMRSDELLKVIDASKNSDNAASVTKTSKGAAVSIKKDSSSNALTLWTVDKLAAGDSVQITFTTVVSTSAGPASELVNAASAACANVTTDSDDQDYDAITIKATASGTTSTTDSSTTNSGSTKAGTIPTGDAQNPFLFMMLIGAAAAAMALVMAKNRKRR